MNTISKNKKMCLNILYFLRHQFDCYFDRNIIVLIDSQIQNIFGPNFIDIEKYSLSTRVQHENS